MARPKIEMYSQTPFFDNKEITSYKNRNYASVTNYFTDKNEALSLNVYVPKPVDKTAGKYPLIVLAHGGAFQAGDKKIFADTCFELAKRGFVAATINYRIGWNERREYGKCRGDSWDLLRAWYNGVQDMNRAIQTLITQIPAIDSNCVFVGGSSAGAALALGVSYVKQNDVDEWRPEYHQLYGKLNTGQQNFKIKGCISMWGAMLSTRAMKTTIPALFLHGTSDESIPFDSSFYLKCRIYPKTVGARPIARKLEELNVPYHFYAKKGAGHGHAFWTEKEKNTALITFLSQAMKGNIRKTIKVSQYTTRTELV